jgi:hypothetical protein
MREEGKKLIWSKAVPDFMKQSAAALYGDQRTNSYSIVRGAWSLNRASL